MSRSILCLLILQIFSYYNNSTLYIYATSYVGNTARVAVNQC